MSDVNVSIHRYSYPAAPTFAFLSATGLSGVSFDIDLTKKDLKALRKSISNVLNEEKEK